MTAVSEGGTWQSRRGEGGCLQVKANPAERIENRYDGCEGVHEAQSDTRKLDRNHSKVFISASGTALVSAE